MDLRPLARYARACSPLENSMADDLRHLHDRDFALWALTQARALREKRYDALDREILANELERLVSRERNEINQRVQALTVQLMMWTVQPAMRTDSFQSSILEQRTTIDTLLRMNPSLRPAVEDALSKNYAAALDTITQAGISRTLFPPDPVFTLDQLVDRAFWPASIFGGRAFSF